MNSEHRDILRSQRDILLKSIKLEDITQLLREYKIFNRYMWKDITSTADMLDALPFRGPKAFPYLIEILKKAQYFKEADLLEGRKPVQETIDKNLCYKMSSKPLGLCLIINNMKFRKSKSENESNVQESPEYRSGSEVDVTSLRDFFESIDFDVTVENDMEASKMIACLMEFSRRDFRNIDSLIIIILSHGNQKHGKDYVFGIDYEFVSKTDIIDAFSNRNCTELQNKPKMFFFICCRGETMDYGVPNCLPNESVDTSVVIMPSLSDIFVIHSTLPNHYSVRDNLKGSYFCQEFVTVLKEHHQIHDLETMIKLVNANLKNRVSRIYHTIQVAHVEVLGGTKKIMLCKTQS